MPEHPTPLNRGQIMATFLTMVVRNNLEGLHAGRGPISDSLMKRINQYVRNAIYTGLHATDWQDRSISARRYVDYHLRSIPSYWEPPDLLPGYRQNLEPETDGARPAPIAESSPEYKAALDVVRPMLGRIAATTEGRSIRGARGAPLKRSLERLGVDRYLKLSPKERQEAHRLSYLEADLAERTRILIERGNTKQSDAA